MNQAVFLRFDEYKYPDILSLPDILFFSPELVRYEMTDWCWVVSLLQKSSFHMI